MNDTGSFILGVLRDVATSAAVILAAWGALGGATNALTCAVRQMRTSLSNLGAVSPQAAPS